MFFDVFLDSKFVSVKIFGIFTVWKVKILEVKVLRESTKEERIYPWSFGLVNRYFSPTSTPITLKTKYLTLIFTPKNTRNFINAFYDLKANADLLLVEKP
jgi:hypothetical protein